jgi:Rhs element Vgr protein
MPTATQQRSLPIPAAHREFTVKIDGQMVTREYQLLAVNVTLLINKITSARLVYLDGAAARSDFPASNTEYFIPGKTIEILAGSGDDPKSIFKGVVLQQSIRIRDTSAPQLVVECRHAASKMTLKRNSAYYFDQKDSDILTDLIGRYGISADVDGTDVQYKQQVQYNVSDWDFLLTRAEANGRVVLTHDDSIQIVKPSLTASEVCNLEFGATILEMDAQMDARTQYPSVTSHTWDPAQQAIVSKDAQDPAISGPGNLDSGTLADANGMDDMSLQHVAISEEEAQAWADACWLKSQLARISGRAKCEGIAMVKPGDMVRLSGVGERYSGKVFVTGVRHDFDTVQGWKTHVQFGNTQHWFAEEHTLQAPKASALIAGVNGLQIGVVVSNEDPDDEDRVRVRMPMVNGDDDGTWARVASLDAGKERGFFFRPEVGDEVVLGFLNDDPRQAVILGMLHSSAHPAPLKGSDDNHEKLYQSREKLKLYFNDDKKIAKLETPAGNILSLSEDEQSITLQDQNGNKIEMTSDGIKIESSKAIELKAATEIKMESGTAFSAKGGTELKLMGSVGTELSSSATTKVKGSLVMIN